MDDQCFDQKTAQAWIALIEQPQNPRVGDIYPFLRAWLGQLRPQQLLEIGAGQGCCVPEVLEHIAYTGVDASPFLIARAQAQFEGPTFVVGNAYALPFAAQSFDAAFSIALWHLLGDLPLALAEMHRVLKPKGHFLAITAHPAAYALWQGRYTESQVVGERLEGRMSATGELDILYLYPLEKLRQMLEDAGFEILSLEGFRPVQDQNMFLMIKGQKR